MIFWTHLSLERRCKMKLTVNQALQLRNELEKTKEKIQQVAVAGRWNSVGSISFGKTVENDLDITDRSAIPFPDFFESISRINSMIHELNLAITHFNVSEGIYDLVGSIKLNKELLKLLEIASAQKPYTKTRRDSASKEVITTTFTPFMSRDDLRKTIKKVKKVMRDAQNEIYLRNAEEIEVKFSQADVDSFDLD